MTDINTREALVSALKTIYVWAKHDAEATTNAVKSFKDIADKAEEALKKAEVL